MSRGFRNADSTQDLSEKATAEQINDILEREREQVRRSADLRAHGVHGLCEDCRRPIGADRLLALPHATRCVDCQARWEQANRI
ncbi:MAG TPA: TraR/DksA C4-type zinc finger protein [Candidatus Dormibacteraeota bacterium]|nr:TraR/DksA C4-type zinc finger protein [Candidatus Dormibacteraeota bacterium]